MNALHSQIYINKMIYVSLNVHKIYLLIQQLVLEHVCLAVHKVYGLNHNQEDVYLNVNQVILVEIIQINVQKHVLMVNLLIIVQDFVN
jgi:hypothetical protein